MLIIGAPFGNYLNQWPHTIPTFGTFTREYRGGFWKRLWRVLRTVRYYPGIGAWKNQLGLPNPGIDSLEIEPALAARSILSISARNTPNWLYLLNVASSYNFMAVELNVSCPNCNEVDDSDYIEVFKYAAVIGKEIIVKLPPVNYGRHVSLAFSQGLSSFHCCNTLPTPGGGLSGKPLKPLSLRAVAHLRSNQYSSSVKRLIGGGGVTSISDANEYMNAGCTDVSVASVLFNPFKWSEIRIMAAFLHDYDQQRS
jgi:dihydroorotate dehydrogenase